MLRWRYTGDAVALNIHHDVRSNLAEFFFCSLFEPKKVQIIEEEMRKRKARLTYVS